MRTWIEAGWGEEIDQPTRAQQRALLERLDPEEEEHGGASLTREDAWCLGCSAPGAAGLSVAWLERLEGEGEGEPKHLAGVPLERLLDLFAMLQEGRDAELRALPWQPGYEPPRSSEEQARLVREAEARVRASDRQTYDRFGPERPGVRCREAGCQRGAVAHSTLCRPHHFENVVGRPCPFDD